MWINIWCKLLQESRNEIFDIYEKSVEDRSKAETLFSAIGNAMKKRSIGWNIYVCITVDSTNLNIG